MPSLGSRGPRKPVPQCGRKARPFPQNVPPRTRPPPSHQPTNPQRSHVTEVGGKQDSCQLLGLVFLLLHFWSGRKSAGSKSVCYQHVQHDPGDKSRPRSSSQVTRPMHSFCSALHADRALLPPLHPASHSHTLPTCLPHTEVRAVGRGWQG